MGFFEELFGNTNSKDLVFTIDREHGSGGYDIAKKLSAKLNIPLYDEEVIELKTLEGKVNPDNITKDDSFLQGTIYDLYRENYSYSQEDIVNVDAVFLANSKTIRDFARQGSCIIMGKCSNYVLREYKNTFNIFISADEEFKIKRLMDFYESDREKAVSKMKKKDVRRKNHYNRFTNGEWGMSSDYDLTVNSAKYDFDDIVDLIISASKRIKK